MPAIIEHLESVVGELDKPPILMGHSAGGVFTQILMDHGFGAVGVAINSAPTEGVKRVPLSQIKAAFPVLKNPANRHKAVGLTLEQWHYAFTNTFSEEESKRLYERYHVPASGAIFWGSALANIHPGPDDSHVNYKNPDRAPLLFISGDEDHLMPPSLQQSNAKHYKAEGLVTEVKEFAGPHLLPAKEGWEEVADYALDVGRGTRRRRRRASESHPDHAHRRADGPARVRRLAHRHGSDVRRPRPDLQVRLGHVVAQGTRTGDRRVRPRADRRGAAHARPPRRQPRRRGTRAASVSWCRRHDCVGRQAPRRCDARGLVPWQTTRLESPGKPTIDVTATPCRHGPPLSHPIVGDVIGFALRWDGQEHGVMWISGDTVLYDGVREVANRFTVDVALLHLGAARFPQTGSIKYTMTARDAVELCRTVKPRTVIPVHYEGWSHFRQGLDGIEHDLGAAPDEIRRSFRVLTIGDAVQVGD